MMTWQAFGQALALAAAFGAFSSDPGQASAQDTALVDASAIDDRTSCGIGRWKRCTVEQAEELGLFETGLVPKFPQDADCRDIDDGYAISYSHKRPRDVRHGGIDMPAPEGTPIIAAADGTVVAIYRGEKSTRGIELVLRHTPEETGIPLWIYTQYTHFSEMPKLVVGQRVRMGEYLGPTGNSGIDARTRVQSTRRRMAIHFGVFYSAKTQYADKYDHIIPVEGHWMDPVALYRKTLPLDSVSMKDLPEDDKQVPISVMFEDGKTYPADTKIIWPYACARE